MLCVAVGAGVSFDIGFLLCDTAAFENGVTDGVLGNSKGSSGCQMEFGESGWGCSGIFGGVR